MKKIIPGLLTTLISLSALADTASINSTTQMGLLQNEWVKAGVNANTGTLGSGGGTSPGLLFDPAGTGTFNAGYDYLTPGSPFDGFSLKVDGVNKTNNNTGTEQITGQGLTAAAESLAWTGSVDFGSGAWTVTNTYALGAGKPYIDITSSITAGSAATTVNFAKFIDPDSQGMPGDSSATDNVLGYGAIPSTNVAFSEATVSRYALGLYSTDHNVTAGINHWSTDAASYSGTVYAGGALYGTSDDTIGLSWTWTGVSAGDILTANYAYIFGPSAFAAASSAVTGGAGGGDTSILTGTLTDVGSATDAASTPSTPTLVGSTTTYTTVVTEAPSSTLPVLTASITHHTASEAAGLQTIARETTTTVTTPVDVTTTVTPTTVDTYSDSSTVTTVGTPAITTVLRNDVTTAVTDPGSFVARADQMTTLERTHSSINRTLSFEGVNIIGVDVDHSNSMSGEVKGVAVGGSRQLDNGWSIGAGFGAITAKVSGVDGTGTADTNLFNIHAAKSVSKGVFDFSVTHAATDYSIARTIGTFTNQGASTGTDTWASIRFVGNGEHFRPVIGAISGRREIDAYTETGSIQSARSIAKFSDDYTEGLIGAQITAGPVTAELLHYTNNVNSLNIAVVRQLDNNKTVYFAVQRVESDFNDSNSVKLGVNIKF